MMAAPSCSLFSGDVFPSIMGCQALGPCFERPSPQNCEPNQASALHYPPVLDHDVSAPRGGQNQMIFLNVPLFG